MIWREIEDSRPLRIAVLGYNRKLAIKGILKIVESLQKSNDPPVRVIPKMGKIETKYGNVYEALMCNSYLMVEGTRYDQLLIVDDYRREIFYTRGRMIQEMAERLDDNIPQEFKVQFMEV